MRIDLHTHSSKSDGTDTPAELMRKAKQVAQLDIVALTDHDATAGWVDAQKAADEYGITLVKGIEISTKYNRHSVHLLGYEFDADDPNLTAELAQVRAGRDERTPTILQKLADEGFPLTAAEVAAKAERAAAVGRPHIADALVTKYPTKFKTRDDVFNGWLNEGGSAYVKRYSADLVGAIKLLKAAGGVAVVAHPWAGHNKHRLSREAFEELVDAGLDGIEVDHSDHPDDVRAELRQLAADLDIVATGSSDYHGDGKPQPPFHLGANTTHEDQYRRLFDL